MKATVEIIQKLKPNFTPKVGIVLGSGLGDLASAIESPTVIPYQDIPGFPEISVAGHSGNLILGMLNGVPVAALQGRAHYYEKPDYSAVRITIRTLKLLGCEIFIATNASGSLMPEAGPGSLVLITDHINFQPGNPLIGPNDDAFGPRFLPMDKAYDLELRNKLKSLAEIHNIKLHEGVYLCDAGPIYETAAEIRAFRVLGADVVGMSTVPEVVVAHHCGMKIAVISMVTNFATGLTERSHDHSDVVATALKGSGQLQKLISALLAEL